MDEQWVVDILLHDAGFLARPSLFHDNLLQLVPLLGHLDTHAPVGALTWLCDPNIIRVCMVLVILLKGQIIRIVEALLYMEGHR